jgi:hypothetical protein
MLPFWFGIFFSKEIMASHSKSDWSFQVLQWHTQKEKCLTITSDCANDIYMKNLPGDASIAPHRSIAIAIAIASVNSITYCYDVQTA